MDTLMLEKTCPSRDLNRWDFRRVSAVTTLDSRPVAYLCSSSWELTISVIKYKEA
jgi:hypothetical protein